MHRTICLALLLLQCVDSAAASDTANRQRDHGGVLYARYCASCHGSSGRGDGNDASLFRPPPTDLRAGILQRYEITELARRVRTGAQLGLVVNPEALRQHAADVEAIVEHMKKLPSLNWRSIEAGWELYVERCEICHGPTGKPESLPPGVKTPRSLSDPAFQKSMERNELVEVVRHGRQGMPALTPRLSIQQGQRIASFVGVLSPGFTLYTRYCSNCHADDGRGAQSLGEVLGEEIALPAIVFDRTFFANRSPEKLRQAVWHMLTTHQPQMPHFRYLLTQAQIESIISYLKSSTVPSAK